MVTKKSSAEKSSNPAASKTPTKPDAVKLLTSDHKEVKQLFKDYEKLADGDADNGEKEALAQQICSMLTVHAQIEEEIFYPAAEAVLEEADLVDEAAVEHATAKDLIAQIEGMSATEPLYDAKVKVLGEYIDHHVKEEEGEMFPQAKKSGMDVQAIGEQLLARKQELMAELGVADAAEQP